MIMNATICKSRMPLRQPAVAVNNHQSPLSGCMQWNWFVSAHRSACCSLCMRTGRQAPRWTRPVLAKRGWAARTGCKLSKLLLGMFRVYSAFNLFASFPAKQELLYCCNDLVVCAACDWISCSARFGADRDTFVTVCLVLSLSLQKHAELHSLHAPPVDNLHSALHTLPCTLYTLYTFYTSHSTLCTWHSAFCGANSTLRTAKPTLHTHSTSFADFTPHTPHPTHSTHHHSATSLQSTVYTPGAH